MQFVTLSVQPVCTFTSGNIHSKLMVLFIKITFLAIKNIQDLGYAYEGNREEGWETEALMHCGVGLVAHCSPFCDVADGCQSSV